MNNVKYNMAFIVGSLLHRESVIIAELFLLKGNWDIVRDAVLSKNLLQARTISGASSAGEKTKALKEIEKIKKIIVEINTYERDILYPHATKKIEIDLDDGVKANYLKFGKALKKIPGL